MAGTVSLLPPREFALLWARMAGAILPNLFLPGD